MDIGRQIGYSCLIEQPACDPNPTHQRYLQSHRKCLPTDLNEIGRVYVGALAAEIDRWVSSLPAGAPIGVMFSGGIVSGTVLLATYQVLLNRGDSPARLKAFTLSVDERGSDLKQARDFLHAVDLDFLLEPIVVDPKQVDFREAIRVMEDYKPLDTASLAAPLENYTQCLEQELRLIDALVYLAYSTLHNLDCFVASCMLYFVAATYTEASGVVEKTAQIRLPWGLGAQHHLTHVSCRRIWKRVQR